MWLGLFLLLALMGCAAQRVPLYPNADMQPMFEVEAEIEDAGETVEEDEEPPVWLWSGPCRLDMNRQLLVFKELTRDNAEIAWLYRGVRWSNLREVLYPRHTFVAVVKWYEGNVAVYQTPSGKMPTERAFFDGRRWFDPDNCSEMCKESDCGLFHSNSSD